MAFGVTDGVDFSGGLPMGSNRKAWFGWCMNKLNARARKQGRPQPTRPSAPTPTVIRLRVAAGKGGSSWTVPLERAVAALAKTNGRSRDRDLQRIELNLIRSVTQSGLRRSGSIWGR
jgi:hypothetical protein